MTCQNETVNNSGRSRSNGNECTVMIANVLFATAGIQKTALG